MDLKQQVQVLIENAPQDGLTPQVVEAISPVLTLLASQLGHLEYHILQTLNGDWVVTTLSNRTQPELEKNVIYAFATDKDATGFQPVDDPQLVTATIPVTHILFQLLALATVTSLVFFDTPGNLATGTEVRRKDLEDLIQRQLKQVQPAPRSYPNNIPPDFA
jgi:hypothetical protein